MRSPLAPYLDRCPTPADFTSVSTDALRRIIAAAREVESLSRADLTEAAAWARSIREAAERALAGKR